MSHQFLTWCCTYVDKTNNIILSQESLIEYIPAGIIRVHVNVKKFGGRGDVLDQPNLIAAVDADESSTRVLTVPDLDEVRRARGRGQGVQVPSLQSKVGERKHNSAARRSSEDPSASEIAAVVVWVSWTRYSTGLGDVYVTSAAH